jgi:hypothetical protein
LSASLAEDQQVSEPVKRFGINYFNLDFYYVIYEGLTGKLYHFGVFVEAVFLAIVCNNNDLPILVDAQVFCDVIGIVKLLFCKYLKWDLVYEMQ